MRSEVVPVCRTGSGALFFVSASDHDGTSAGQVTRFWWARLELGEAAWSFNDAAAVHTIDLASIGVGDGTRAAVTGGETLERQLVGPALDCSPADVGTGWVWDQGLTGPGGTRVSGAAVHTLTLEGTPNGAVGPGDPGPCRRAVERILSVGDRTLYVLATCGPGEVERYVVEGPARR